MLRLLLNTIMQSRETALAYVRLILVNGIYIYLLIRTSIVSLIRIKVDLLFNTLIQSHYTALVHVRLILVKVTCT